MTTNRVSVRVDNRTLQVSNLDKVLYPATGFTKRDVIDYYRQIAPVLLPHVRGRPATMIRFPDGVDGESFFEKNVSRHAPDWIPTVALRSGANGSGESVNYHLVLADVPALVWAANLAALELHVPQWTVDSGTERRFPDLLVFDLDPGAPATIVDCCAVAELLHEILAADGLRAYPKTSGSKGMQLYCPIHTNEPTVPAAYAKQVAQRLEKDHPKQVVARMKKSVRRNKVFIDWSQNNPAKTTVAPYSLRARPHPTVSTPITWDEVRLCRRPDDLAFSAEDVVSRVNDHGDLLDDLHRDPTSLDAAADTAE